MRVALRYVYSIFILCLFYIYGIFIVHLWYVVGRERLGFLSVWLKNIT